MLAVSLRYFLAFSTSFSVTALMIFCDSLAEVAGIR